MSIQPVSVFTIDGKSVPPGALAPLSGGVSRNRHRETTRAIPFHSRMSHRSLTLPLDVIYANDFEAPHHDSTLKRRVRRRGT